MRWRNTSDHYGLVTKVLHWVTAGLVIGLIGLGWYLDSLGFFDRRYDRLLNWHQALGMSVLVLAALTAIWRRVTPSPEPVSALTALERWAGHAVQHALYALLWLLPLSGYVIATANGEALELFGVLSLPAIGPVSASTRDRAIDVHVYLSYAALGLVGMHAGAALKHELWNRDGVLARMLWR